MNLRDLLDEVDAEPCGNQDSSSQDFEVVIDGDEELTIKGASYDWANKKILIELEPA